MTGQLRHELHAMVDDAVGVDLIDDALRDARGRRRRRNATAASAAAAVAAVAVAPIALGSGWLTGTPVGGLPGPAPSSSVDHSGCGDGGVNSPNLVTEAAEPLATVRVIISGHLPAGYKLDSNDGYSLCGSDPAYIADYRIVKLAPAGPPGTARVPLLSVTRVTRTDLVDGLSYPLGGPIISTRCADLLQPMPSRPAPMPSQSVTDKPTANPLATAGPPHVVSCDDGTATDPMVYVVAQGPSLTAGAVYPDHHAVVAQAIDQPMLTAAELRAIATDPRLSAPVTVH